MRLLTPSGPAGVAVVATSQSELSAAGVKLLQRSGNVATVTEDTVSLCALVVQGRVLDEAIVVGSGDGNLEIHVHGAPAVLAALLDLLPQQSAATDPVQEFLRESQNCAQLDLALEQSCHDFAAEVAWIRKLPPEVGAVQMAAALDRSKVAMAHRRPLRVVLMGQRNVGKSTLFNRLLSRERSLSGDTLGLTRDPVTEVADLAGYPYELVDTAGECEGQAGLPLEASSIQRSREMRADACCILVVDANKGPSDVDRLLLPAANLVVANKSDLPHSPWPAAFPLHATLSCSRDASATLREQIGGLLRAFRGLPPAGPVGGFAAMDERQLRCLLG